MGDYRRRRRPRRLIACAALTLGLSGCHLLDGHSNQPHVGGSPSSHQPSTTSYGTSGTSTLPSGAAALIQLSRLKVVERRPFIPGYQRSCDNGAACVFGQAWADNPRSDGCSTRQDLLKTSLTSVTLEHDSRCAVESGHLVDPYSGASIAFHADQPDSIEIDHVVPLISAWALGAARWTQQQRVRFANDSSIELVAVSRASNQAKGEQGPSEYQPRVATCAYNARYVAVLTKYHLPVIAADKSAMTRVLRGCR